MKEHAGSSSASGRSHGGAWPIMVAGLTRSPLKSIVKSVRSTASIMDTPGRCVRRDARTHVHVFMFMYGVCDCVCGGCLDVCS